MLLNISFVDLILSLIIFEQRVSLSVLPPLTEEAPLFVFLVRLQHLLLRTTCWCIGGGRMQPMAVREDGKVGGGGRGDR
jgi:hypothetical protein